MRVPYLVELKFWDERVRPDLGIPAHRAMLCSELRRQSDGPIYLVELPEPGVTAGVAGTGRHGDIIVSWLATTDTLDSRPLWWATPTDPDLELVIKPAPDAYAGTVGYLNAFTQPLIDNRLVRDAEQLSWRPDTVTWGEGEHLELAEAFLAADARVLHSTRIPAATGIDPAVLTAFNVLAITADFEGDADLGLR